MTRLLGATAPSAPSTDDGMIIGAANLEKSGGRVRAGPKLVKPGKGETNSLPKQPAAASHGGAVVRGRFPGMRFSSIAEPSETITIGERKSGSKDDSYMDILPPEFGSDHLVEVDHAKHRAGKGERIGGSNYAFADGSVRFLKFGAAFSPKNLWAVTERFRNAPLPEL